MSCEFDLDLLFAALDKKREFEGLSWAGVGREIENRYTKVSPATIKGVSDNQVAEGDGVLQMLLWLGMSPENFVPGFNAQSEHELIEPKNAILRFDVKKVYRLLDAKRGKDELTWTQVAEQIGGCTANMLTRFRNGGRTSFPRIVRIALWLEVPVKVLTKSVPLGTQ